MEVGVKIGKCCLSFTDWAFQRTTLQVTQPQQLSLPLDVVFYTRLWFPALVYNVSCFCCFSSIVYPISPSAVCLLYMRCVISPFVLITSPFPVSSPCTPPPCLRQCLMTLFCMQNDLSGRTSFPFLSTRTSNLLPLYFTAPNVCNVLVVFLAVVLMIHDISYSSIVTPRRTTQTRMPLSIFVVS